MKKMINTSFAYLVLALVAGVFYREFTKLNGFTGETVLSVLHTHLFVLGVFAFLMIALLIKNFPSISEHKGVNRFYLLYNISLVLFSVMLLVRGIVETLQVPVSVAVDASISGIAGISHLLLAISFLYFFMILRKTATEPTLSAD